MTTPFLLYGANGFVGEAVARLSCAKGVQPVLAGRDADKLKALASQLNLPAGLFHSVCTWRRMVYRLKQTPREEIHNDIKLSAYACHVGVSYRTALRQFKIGKIKGRQIDTDTVLITEPFVVPGHLSLHMLNEGILLILPLIGTNSKI